MNSLLIVIFSISLSSSIIAPLVGPIIFSETGFFEQSSLDYKMSMYALIVGVYPLGAMIGNLALGFLSDKIDKKKVLIIAIFGTMLAYNICAFSFFLSMFFLLLIGRFLDGLMAGRRAVAISFLAGNHANMNDVFRRSETANALGLLLGPLLSGFLAYQIASMGFHYYSLIFGVLLIICIINLYFIVKKLPYSSTYFPAKGSKKRLNIYQFFLYIIYFLIQYSFYIYIVSLPPLLAINWAFSPMIIGTILAFLTLTYSLSLIFFNPLASRLYNQRVALYGALLFAAVLLILLSVGHKQLGVFILINFSIVVSLSLITPLFKAKVFGDNNIRPGLALGIQNSVLGLAWLSAAIVIGIMPISYYALLFAMAGGCLLIIIVGLFSVECFYGCD